MIEHSIVPSEGERAEKAGPLPIQLETGASMDMPASRRRAVIMVLAAAAAAWVTACGDDTAEPPTPPNQRPVAVGTIADRTVAVGETAALDASEYFSDPDGDALSYEAESSDEAVAAVSVSGSVVTVVAVARGAASVTVTASDPEGLSAEQSFAVTVPNRAPVALASIPALEVGADEALAVDASEYFSDPDGDALSYEAESSDGAVATVSVSGSVVTVVGAAKGAASVTVTASDPGGLSAGQSFAVTVPNRAPVALASIPALEVGADEALAVDASEYFSDPDGDALSYEAESSDGAVATVSVSGSVVTVVGAAKGAASVTVTASDPGGLSAGQSFAVTVPNRAPVALASIPALEVGADEALAVDASEYFSDPDGDALSYEAESSDGAVATVSVSGSVVTVVGTAKGAASVTVTASDPGGLSAGQSFAVTVPNRAPVALASIPALEVGVGEALAVDASEYFSDPDGDPLGYEVDSSDGSVARVSLSGSVVTVEGVAKGAASVTVTASDPGGLSAEQSFTVTVPNRAPVILGSIPALEVGADEALTLDASEYFSDPDGDPLGYEVDSSDGSVARVSVSGKVVVVVGVAKGTATVTVTASDPEGLSAGQSFAVTVPNRAPVALGSIPDVEMESVAGEAAAVDPSEYFSDPDGDALSYEAESSDRAVATVSVSGNVVRVVGVATGAASVTVTASDPEGLSAEQSFAVRVGPHPDRVALVAFFEATNGANWANNDNWLTDAPLRDWYGVDTDGFGRVVGVNLAGRWDDEAREWVPHGLEGPIPPALGDLANLRWLDLSNNELSGPIPPELNGLSNLERLNLGGNGLSGPIPPELGGLSDLRDLGLWGNALAGAIPPELADLANLRWLELGGNGLSGAIPRQIGGLSDLRSLGLWDNDLTGAIPPELAGLSNLRWLELGGNALSGPIPREMGSLSALRSLGLWDNDLTGEIPPELGKLANLENLSLGGNDLAGPIPPELGDLSNLRGLWLQNNELTSLPRRVFQKLSNLENLYLNGNRLESLPPGAFLGLSSLRRLDLRYNPGAPFRLTLRPVRTDDDLEAPGPAEVSVSVAEGAPFAVRIPLFAEGGDLSADIVTIDAGRARGAGVTVTRNDDGAAGTRVAAGPAPGVPEDIRGIEIHVAGPILLFEPTAATITFSRLSASAPEGGTAVLEVALSAAASAPLTLRYEVGADDDPETDDADAADHSHGASGTLQVAAGASTASIEIAIADDDDIEPAREVFAVRLDPPGEETGYIRGYPYTATVAIEEGVCDRTPLIRDAIVAAAGSAGCAQTDDADLAKVIVLNIRRGAFSEESGILWTRELAGRIRRGECEPGSWRMGRVGVDATSARAIACGTTPEEAGTTPAPGQSSNNSDGGPITVREGDFAGLPNLGVLYLLGLGLTELPPGVFAGLDNLWWLSLQHNQLTTLPEGVFSDLSNLWEGLILANNRLTSFPETVLSPLTDVGLLILEANELTEVPARAFAGLSGVDWLFLNGNRLASLPSGLFSDMSGLAVLNLGRNQLSGLPTQAFENLSSLRSLYLEGNRLSSLPTQAFAGLSGLQRLGLNFNGLTELPRGVFSPLPALTHLWLSGNPLRTLQTSDFSNLPSLEALHLAQVELTRLPPGLFSDLGNLAQLDLRFNRLNQLAAGAFLGLTKLRGLRLSGNPGAPFPLVLEPRRTDTGDLLAPGPATVRVGLAPGAPFSLGIPLTVHGGDASASSVVLRAGEDASAEVTVTRDGDNPSGAQVVAGPAPALPNAVDGIELVVGDPLVLFGTVSNLAPVAERSVPLLRLRVGGEAASVDVSSHFRDPDGDDLTFAASSGNTDVVSARTSGGTVTVTGVGAGSGMVTVTAADPGGLSAELSFPVTVRGASPGLYDIDLILIDDVSESIQAAFDDAVEYWSSILAGTELSDVPIEQGFELGCWDIRTQQRLSTVDELVIVASVREIDGRSGILASAGYCGVRDGEKGLPFMGAMQFDVADLEWLEENGDMEEVILHEMGHVLGIGTAWRSFGLLVNPSLGNPGADTHFKGRLGIEAFDAAGGTDYDGGEKVPVENQAGPGSGDAHWRESVLDHELMTPYQNGGILDPLSAITIQSLADLGYTVDVKLAEPYRLPGVAAGPPTDPVRKIEYGDDIMRGPIIVVDRRGRIVRVIRN